MSGRPILSVLEGLKLRLRSDEVNNTHRTCDGVFGSGVHVLSEGTVQLRMGPSLQRVRNQFGPVYLCSCCCLRLSSRIRLWAGSNTPASSRSSSVMSLRNSRSSQPLCSSPCSYLSRPSL